MFDSQAQEKHDVPSTTRRLKQEVMIMIMITITITIAITITIMITITITDYMTWCRHKNNFDSHWMTSLTIKNLICRWELYDHTSASARSTE